MKRTLAVTLALVSALALAACGSDSSGGSTTPSPSSSPAGLAGTSWTLATFAGTNGARTSVPTQVKATAEFAAKTVSGSSGCNSFSGPYTSTDTKIDIGPLASTLRACTGSPAAVEAAYLKALDQATGYAIVDDTLTMTGAKDAVLLTFVGATATSLVGSTWTATSINNGKNAVQSVVSGSNVTALFDKDGTVSGNGGCNDYNGPFTTTGDSLTFGALASTKKACEGDIGTQESAYLAALARVTTYAIRGSVLELRDDKGALQVQYTGGIGQ